MNATPHPPLGSEDLILKSERRALTPLRLAWGVAGVLTLAFSITPAVKSAASPGGPRNDFVCFYSGGELAGSPGLYDSKVTAARQKSLGLKDGQYPLPFTRLPFYAALLWPIASMPFEIAYWIWQGISVASFAAAAAIWRHSAPGAVLFAATWNAGFAAALVRGQDTAILFCVLSVAAWTLCKRPWTAGLLFSLCLIKWHLFLLLPVFVMARREWRFACAVTAGAAGLIAWSSWLNPEWIRVYGTAITAPGITPNQGTMPSLHALAQGSPWAAVSGTLATAVLSWVAMRRAPDSDSALALLFLGGVLVSPHVYPPDCVLLLPATLLACGTEFRMPVRVLGWATPVLPAFLLVPGLSFVVQAALLALFAGIVLSWTIPHLAKRHAIAISRA